jgi:hypothetical protein
VGAARRRAFAHPTMLGTASTVARHLYEIRPDGELALIN